MNTKPTDQATARPWRIADSSEIHSESGQPICTLADEENSNLSASEANANATLIVSAVNEREALLAVAEAAKAIRQEFSASLSSGLRAKLDAALETLAALQKGDK